MARSLAYALLAGALAYVLVTGLWGVMDGGASTVMEQPRWENTSRGYTNASNATAYAAEGQGYTAALWNNVPLISAIAIAFSVLVRSRGGA